MIVTIMPAGMRVTVEENAILSDVFQKAGIDVLLPCGGNRTCGKCKVLVTKGNDRGLTREEEKLLSEDEKKRGMRLACAFAIKEDTTVMVPSRPVKKTEHFSIRSRKNAKQESMEYALAIDIGTTTVEITVVDVEKKNATASIKLFNPQSRYGADVVSRITYCINNSDGEGTLKQVLMDEVNSELKECYNRLHIKQEQVIEAVIVCNTTMSYLITGTSIKGLAKSPFALEFLGNCYRKPEELGLAMSKTGQIYMAPNIGGHVGSDAYACLIAMGLNEKKGKHLLVDVGTNGEILLARDGEIYACSTAAGPAFEGAGLSCGMRATAGAIIKAVENGGKIKAEVAGNVPAEGISGSGIIDVLACMLKLGMMDNSGYIRDDCYFAKGFEVTKNVLVTRNDVRQIQLAKGAIYAGIMSLLQIAEVEPEELDGLYLAGAFGSGLNIENAMAIGLIPRVDATKARAVGNAAMRGAVDFIMCPNKREEGTEIIKKIKHVELAQYKSFQDIFIKSINFRNGLF